MHWCSVYCIINSHSWHEEPKCVHCLQYVMSLMITWFWPPIMHFSSCSSHVSAFPTVCRQEIPTQGNNRVAACNVSNLALCNVDVMVHCATVLYTITLLHLPYSLVYLLPFIFSFRFLSFLPRLRLSVSHSPFCPNSVLPHRDR